MFCFWKNNRVATEVLLQRMGQQEAERRSGQERVSESRNAWAPVLAESVSDLHDVRVECGEDDPLACTAGKQEREIKILQEEKDAMGAEMKRLQEEKDAMGAEVMRLQEENPVWLQNRRAAGHRRLKAAMVMLAHDVKILQEEKDAMGVEMKRLQEENDDLLEQTLRTITTIVVKDLQDKEVSVPLCCPLSLQLFKDPVVSRFGHSFEREDIEKWLLLKKSCPLTNQYMTIAHLSPNRALADVVEAFRAHQAQ